MSGRTNTLLESPWLPFFGSALSGLLLALSFPGPSHPSLAFVGLVPLLLAVKSASAKRAAQLGLLAGFVFFSISLFWLGNLTGRVEGFGLKASAVLGAGVLALYCALYFIPVALTAAACARRWGVDSLRTNLRFMFSVTMVWTAAEYLRSFLFTGFPWNPLGVSQYASPALIQIAEWGGVYMVSACIVWMNAGLFVTINQYIQGLRTRKYRAHIELMIGLLPTATAFGFGMRALIHQPVFPDPVQLALVQPNIEQTAKWDPQMDPVIRTRLEELSDIATRIHGIDLLIWPETAIPDTVGGYRDYSRELLRRVTARDVPLLTGAIMKRDGAFYNSSILYGSGAAIMAYYDKQHLVPFGEYVPFPGLMRKFTPVELDVGHGTESTLMELPGKAPFSVLICFEDTVAPLSVKAVRNGARWLVNQTNDAWFDPSAQSEQHLAHAVFRCVENRIPMARCCNTGVTCTIDAYGRIQRLNQVPRTEGVATGTIHPRPARYPQTFYTRNGDAFAKLALLAAATVGFALRFKGWRRKPKAAIEEN